MIVKRIESENNVMHLATSESARPQILTSDPTHNHICPA